MLLVAAQMLLTGTTAGTEHASSATASCSTEDKSENSDNA